MACQEDGCWRCGSDWVAGVERRTAPRVTPSSDLALAANRDDKERAARQALRDADRMIDEGGSLGAG